MLISASLIGEEIFNQIRSKIWETRIACLNGNPGESQIGPLITHTLTFESRTNVSGCFEKDGVYVNLLYSF